MFIELDATHKYITITNRKPIDHTKYVLEADIAELDKLRRVEYE